MTKKSAAFFDLEIINLNLDDNRMKKCLKLLTIIKKQINVNQRIKFLRNCKQIITFPKFTYNKTDSFLSIFDKYFWNIKKNVNIVFNFRYKICDLEVTRNDCILKSLAKVENDCKSKLENNIQNFKIRPVLNTCFNPVLRKN